MVSFFSLWLSSHHLLSSYRLYSVSKNRTATINIYSSLFTENDSNYAVIAKQTTGLNKLNNNYTAYIQRMTWKSQTFRYNITHTFSYGLNYLQFDTQYGGFGIVSEIFQPVSWVLGISKQKNIWHSLTVSILLVWNNFIKSLLTTKSNESKSVFLTEQASSRYIKIGTHRLVSSRCKTTSSVAILPILPNIALAAR